MEKIQFTDGFGGVVDEVEFSKPPERLYDYRTGTMTPLEPPHIFNQLIRERSGSMLNCKHLMINSITSCCYRCGVFVELM